MIIDANTVDIAVIIPIAIPTLIIWIYLIGMLCRKLKEDVKESIEVLNYIKNLYPDEEMLELFPIPTKVGRWKIRRYSWGGVYYNDYFDSWESILKPNHFLYYHLVTVPAEKRKKEERILRTKQEETLRNYLSAINEVSSPQHEENKLKSPSEEE